ncbi:MAG: amidohydrolase family protein [Clostridia bacterium]|nr:amidohydrolase family protein [Clostridia bacterium]
MIVDFHTHTFPDALAARALEKLSSSSGTMPFLDGTSGSLSASSKRLGIDYSVVLPVATNPLKCGHINESTLKENDFKNLICFGAIHPDCPDWYEELNHISSLGLPGIKLHPVYQGVDFDDLRYLRILYRAGELGLVVVTHAGDDIGFPGEVKCSPEMIANALKQVGEVKLVLAHMGGWECWERVEELLPGFKVYLDTSFSTGVIPTRVDGRFKGRPLDLLSEEDFVRMVRLFGSKRILFGTDSPWSDRKKSIEWIRSTALSDKEKEDIFFGNAIDLLGIDPV